MNPFEQRRVIKEKRLEICNSCERYDKDQKRCRECGCFMEYKAFMPYTSCPLDKWKNIESGKDINK
jgi:hypothetical protein